MSYIRTIAFTSDFHVGSRYAVCPEGFRTPQGQYYTLSEGQLQLNSYLDNYMNKCLELGVDTMIMPGDLLHGSNYKEGGILLMTPDIDEQVDMSYTLLDPYVQKLREHSPRPFQLYAFSGSGYHKTTKGHNPEKDIVEKLGGKFLGMVKNACFPPSKRVFNIHHGQSGAYIYREMMLGREGLHEKFAEAMGKLPKIDVMVRGHWHNFIYIHEHKQHFIQLPCWIAFEPTRITLKLYGKFQPDIGGVIVRIDENDRILVWHFLYDVPLMENKVIEL